MSRSVIHYVDSTLFGGAEQAMLHLAAELDALGYRQTILHHPSVGHGPLADRLHGLRIGRREVPPLRGRAAFRNARAFLRVLGDEKPEIFHAHLNWPLACSAGIVLAAMRRTPGVVATVQLFGDLPRRQSVSVLRRTVPRLVNRYVAVSTAVGRRLQTELDVDASRIVVVQNGIDTERFEARPETKHSVDQAFGPGLRGPVVLCVARLEQQKGLTHLLEAAAGVPDAAFAIAGDGPDRAALERQARVLGISDRVRFLGFREDVPTLLAAASVFVLPSLYEGLPLAALEAMAAGKPVVATDIGGLDEIVRHGESGLLVPPADPEALAGAIRSILADAELAGQMSVESRRMALARFSASRTAAAVASMYESVLRDPSRPRATE